MSTYVRTYEATLSGYEATLSGLNFLLLHDKYSHACLIENVQYAKQILLASFLACPLDCTTAHPHVQLAKPQLACE